MLILNLHSEIQSQIKIKVVSKEEKLIIIHFFPQLIIYFVILIKINYLYIMSQSLNIIKK